MQQLIIGIIAIGQRVDIDFDRTRCQWTELHCLQIGTCASCIYTGYFPIHRILNLEVLSDVFLHTWQIYCWLELRRRHLRGRLSASSL